MSPSHADAVRTTRLTAVVTSAFDGLSAGAAVLFWLSASQLVAASDSAGNVS